MSKKEQKIVLSICIFLTILGITLFRSPGDSILTTRNYGFLLPATFITVYTIIKGFYILFIRKPTEQEIKDYIQKLKDEGKLPESYRNSDVNKDESHPPPLQ